MVIAGPMGPSYPYHLLLGQSPAIGDIGIFHGWDHDPHQTSWHAPKVVILGSQNHRFWGPKPSILGPKVMTTKMIKTWCVKTRKRESQNVPKVCHSASTFFALVSFFTHVFTEYLPQKWSKMGPKTVISSGPKWSILGTPFEHPFSALFRPIGDGVPRSLLVTIPP